MYKQSFCIGALLVSSPALAQVYVLENSDGRVIVITGQKNPEQIVRREMATVGGSGWKIKESTDEVGCFGFRQAGSKGTYKVFIGRGSTEIEAGKSAENQAREYAAGKKNMFVSMRAASFCNRNKFPLKNLRAMDGVQ